MSAFDIKIIAISAMVIDHIGLFFFPNLILLRVIGRLAFPLFAFLIANGAYHTHDINKYMQRIIIFALISQVPFTLANNQINTPFYLNVLFTLFLGLFAIKIIRRTENKRVWIVSVIACSLLASILNTDYGAGGVLSVISFYLFFKNIKLMVLAQTMILILLPTTAILFQSYFHLWHAPFALYYFDALGLFSLFFIFSYNSKEGPKTKYLFYVFYPLQYVVIFFLKMLF